MHFYGYHFQVYNQTIYNSSNICLGKTESSPDYDTALSLAWDARYTWFNLGLQLNVGLEELQKINDSWWDTDL